MEENMVTDRGCMAFALHSSYTEPNVLPYLNLMNWGKAPCIWLAIVCATMMRHEPSFLFDINIWDIKYGLETQLVCSSSHSGGLKHAMHVYTTLEYRDQVSLPGWVPYPGCS